MITLRLHLLAYLEAQHDYFADGRARGMRFEPTAACAELIRAFGLVVRDNGQTLSLHAPEARLDDLRQELAAPIPRDDGGATRGTLDFTVRSTEPAFAYYTEDPAPQTVRFDLGDGADAAAWRAGLGQRWALQWFSRRSIWCYWLLGEWEEKVISIVDTQGQREFESLGLTPIEGSPDHQAHCFRSRAPLALSERVPTGLQLRAGHTAAATRVVMSQLPAPRPTALQFESGPGGRQAVSEIFVSR
ncbi:hypothetical protein AACH06_26930 [Ideonella sp. DXS29W]|uniref:Uncharacterized protein n=1 Tax=Ideonella lacteola TaxID=2984193 RepID=A0ABU9BWX1_9BURK